MTTNPFERLLVDLAAGDVDYVTVGGIACAFNGHVRTTQDVDILVSADPANLERLLRVLVDFGDGHARELSPADFPVEPGAVRIVEDFPLDVFTLLAGQTYEDFEPYIRWWSEGQVPIPYLDARGLVVVKSESVRPRDKMDVLALRQLLDDSKDTG
ncbi:MAG: hypothetical protein ABI333_26275 [bacterium]